MLAVVGNVSVSSPKRTAEQLELRGEFLAMKRVALGAFDWPLLVERGKTEGLIFRERKLANQGGREELMLTKKMKIAFFWFDSSYFIFQKLPSISSTSSRFFLFFSFLSPAFFNRFPSVFCTLFLCGLCKTQRPEGMQGMLLHCSGAGTVQGHAKFVFEKKYNLVPQCLIGSIAPPISFNF